MTEVINLREIILGILMEVMEEEEYSHIVLRNVLEKYQFLDKRDRAFISRVSEGTLENLIQLDYIIDQFAAVKTADMKPAYPKHPSDVGVPAEIHGQRAGQRSVQRKCETGTAERLLQSKRLCQRGLTQHCQKSG